MTGRGRPLYFRLLRVRHLRAGPVTAFLLFEGSIALAVLLTLAEIVTWYGAVAIPITVAIMVKVHDRVARALVAPVAIVQLNATPRLRDSPKVGRSSVGALFGPPAVGVAPIPVLGRAPVLDPQAGAAHHNPSLRDGPRPRDTQPGQAGPSSDHPGPVPAQAAGSESSPGERGDAAEETERGKRAEADRPTSTGGPTSTEGPTSTGERSDAGWLRGNQGHFSL